MNGKPKDTNLIYGIPVSPQGGLPRPLFSLGVALAVLFLATAVLACEKVAHVFDGDTILLESGTHVRYVGIDTPEIDHETGKSEFMAEAAAEANQKWVKGKCVRLEYDQERVDGYGRHLAYVFLPQGEMVNATLVRRGLAHVNSIPPNLKYRQLLVESQRKAMTEGLGIWKAISRSPEARIGNTRTYRFHRPACPFGKQISHRHRVRFKSRFEAFWEGYAPCRRCRP